MARPRTDGKRSATAARVGKPRPTASGGTWQVRAYKPTSGAPHGRVVWRHPDTDKPTSSVPAQGEGVDELFDQIEKALDGQVAIGIKASAMDGSAPTHRDIRALGDLYIAWLELLNRNADYVDNRRSLQRKWIYPIIGTVLVRDWSVEHSEKVLAHARKSGLGLARVEDLGSTLSGMRAAAQRKREGGRWLSRDDNPLEEVSYSRAATIQGAGRNYVLPNKRPATERVHNAIEASCNVRAWEWMPTVISIAGFCAPRLSEQLALRAIDINLEARTLDINGVWHIDHKADIPGDRRERYRVPHPKNKKRRVTPYLGSQHADLLERCRNALGLPETATEDDVVAAIQKERDRRSRLVKNGDWKDYEENSANEPWLFVDSSGVPPTREHFNDVWHLVRDAVEWPTHIPYKNLRHHAALWWKAQGFDWDTIAEWAGHDVRTLHGYYLVAAEDATEKARGTLDDL